MGGVEPKIFDPKGKSLPYFYMLSCQGLRHKDV